MTFGRRMRTLRRRLGLIFALALAVTAVGATASAQTVIVGTVVADRGRGVD